jgi:hypothetical protein
VLRKANCGVVGDVPAFAAPVEEYLESDQVVIVGAGCFDAGQLAPYFLMGDVVNRPNEGEAVEQALVGVSGAFPAALLFLVDEELHGLAVGEGVRPDFPQCELCQKLPGFESGFTEGKGRVLSDREAAVPVLDQKGL